MPTIVPGTAQAKAVLFNKPKPWTPIRPFILERELSNHPNKTFVEELIHDLCYGCTIGYTGPQFSYLANNLLSANQQPEVIDATLEKECEVGRILGPFESPPLPNFRTSGLGLVPKHDGGWRIIYHLSAPLNHNINDFINPVDYSLSYCSIDDAYDFINKLGPGTLLSKINLKDAFRLIPVNPSDWNLLGIHWKGKFYVDTCLPFGLRSAPYLFNRLSEAIYWTLTNNYGVQHLLHYLDDFLTAGPANSAICSQNLNAMLSLCEKINSPVKSSKIEGPSTSLTFLGIHLDTVTMEASITAERKESLLQELRYLHSRHKCTKRQLLSSIGKLSFSCKVVPDTYVLIELRQSKTDPFRRGQSIRIYATNSSTCPVRALKLFANKIDTKLPQLHVFSAGTLSPLTRSKLTEILRHLLSQAGMYPSNYASHSFQIGAATTAAAAGLPTWLIKTLGRWSSNAYLTYVRCPNSVIASVPKKHYRLQQLLINPSGTLTSDCNICTMYACT